MWLSTRRRSGRGKCRVHWELKAGAPLRHIYSLTGESAGVLTAERLEQNILQGLGGGQVCGRIHSDVVLLAITNTYVKQSEPLQSSKEYSAAQYSPQSHKQVDINTLYR